MQHTSMKLKPLALAIGLTAVPAIALAQEPQDMGTVVVTATGSAIDLRDAPASISVITREDLERTPVNSLADVLSSIPGITGGFSNTGAGSKISFRGMPDKYTLILVNGRRTGGSSLLSHRPDTTPQDLNWITPDMIERVEVIRGPMSSLHGSDAMGGVINIITRRVAPEWRGTLSSDLTAPARGDRGQSFRLGANISGPLAKNLNIQLGANSLTRAADDTPNDPVTGQRANSGERSANVNAQIDWRLAENHTLIFDLSRGEKNSIAVTNPDSTSETFGPEKLIQTGFGITHEGQYGNLSSTVSLYHNRDKNDAERVATVSMGTTAYNNGQAWSEETVLDAKIDTPLTLGLDQWLTVGAQYKTDELENWGNLGNMTQDKDGNPITPERNQDSYAWAVFAEDQLFLRDNLTVTLGARLDGTDGYGSNFSPRAYVVYHPTNALTLKGGVSQGFRAPNIKERSGSSGTASMGMGCNSLEPLGYTGGGCVMLGNPDLEPETSTSYEFGVAFERNNLSFEITYFYNDVENLMQNGFYGEIGGQWYTITKNVEEAVTSGIETALSVPLLDNLTWKTNLTYMLESENKSTKAPLNNISEITANTALYWTISDRWSTHLTAQYLGSYLYDQSATSVGNATSELQTDAYISADWGFNYTPHDSLIIRAGIQNLEGSALNTGDDYGEGRSRTYYVGMTSRF